MGPRQSGRGAGCHYQALPVAGPTAVEKKQTNSECIYAKFRLNTVDVQHYGLKDAIEDDDLQTEPNVQTGLSQDIVTY